MQREEYKQITFSLEPQDGGAVADQVQQGAQDL